MSFKLLVLTRYGVMGASSRLRTYQYSPFLKEASIDTNFEPLFNDYCLKNRYLHGHYSIKSLIGSYWRRFKALQRRKQFDCLWIEKEALPWLPYFIEAQILQGVPYVLDYDDAVFHNYDQHSNPLICKILGRRLDKLMSKSALVICGNDYLARKAQNSNAPCVEILPTVIDLRRYPSPLCKPLVSPQILPRIVWIGSPSTVRYLELLRKPLQSLSQRLPFVLRVIGAKYTCPGVQVECFPWDESTEVSLISACDVGVMPLIDGPFERGKCGYKLIQYMACGLPVVATPVGVNQSIVEHGKNGFLANSEQDWLIALEHLLLMPNLRRTMSQVGRSLVENKYCLQVTSERLAQLLIDQCKAR